MSKIFIIGLPRTGTTSVSVALLDYGFKVAHQAYTKRAFELADVISDAPCFSDYRQLDKLFPDAKFVYLDRELDRWLPSIQMLLEKMQPRLMPISGNFNPVMKRSFNCTFELDSIDNPLEQSHLARCYQRHKQGVFDYFKDRDDFISIDISQDSSLSTLLDFLAIKHDENAKFPHLNIGKRVACWQEHKHPNKVNANSAGIERRKFFDYQ